jgi:hypothetical protein
MTLLPRTSPAGPVWPTDDVLAFPPEKSQAVMLIERLTDAVGPNGLSEAGVAVPVLLLAFALPPP